MVNSWNKEQDEIGLYRKQPEQEKQTLGSLVGLDKANSAPAAAPTNNGIQATGGKQTKANITGNGYGMRSMLNQAGYGNDAIGWNGDTGMVTLNGNDFYKPDRVIDGVSYVDDPEKVYQKMGEMGGTAMQAALQGYKNQGTNVVQATDYVANKGTNFQVDWNDGNLTVNGIPVKHKFVSNGKAYVDSAELDKAIAQAQKAAGVQNEADILRKYDDRYGGRIENMLDSLQHRKAFDYDPLDDPAYLAYRDMYNREGDRAMRDAMGAASQLSGGYMNSAAAIAAAQQNNYYTQQLNDRVPELMQFAYQRYADDFDRNRQVLSDILNVDNHQFNREYGVNQDIINRINYNNQLNEARDDKAYERAENKLQSDRDWEYKIKMLDDQLQTNAANRRAIESGVLTEEMNRELQKSLYNGNWTERAIELGFNPDILPYAYQQWINNEDLRVYKDKGAFDTDNQLKLLNN